MKKDNRIIVRIIQNNRKERFKQLREDTELGKGEIIILREYY
jgi:hypothetical protein